MADTAIVILTGQSLNEWRGGSRILETGWTGAKMLNGGGTMSQMDYFAVNNDLYMDGNEATSVVQYSDGAGNQSPNPGIASYMQTAGFGNIYLFGCARGSADYNTLWGRGSLVNMLYGLQRLVKLAAADGYSDPAIVFYHAHGERAATDARTEQQYFDDSVRYFQRLQAIASQVKGDPDYVAPIFFSMPLQNKVPTAGVDASNDIAIKNAIKTLKDSGDVQNLFVLPTYPLTLESGADYTHGTPDDFIRRGEYVGKLITEYLADTRYEQLRIKQVTRSGTTVTVKFTHNVVRDVTNNFGSSLNGFDGFEYLDNGSDITINNVTYSGDTATITLNSTPVGTDAQQVLRLGLQVTAASGANITGQNGTVVRKDMTGEASVVDVGFTHYDWALQEEVSGLPYFHIGTFDTFEQDSLAFYALDTQNGIFVPDVIHGAGSITEDSTSTRYYPDDSNVWQEFTSGVVGQYYYNGEWYMPYHVGWTNSCEESYDLTNVNWTKSNVTAALDQIGMRNNPSGASLLTATANNGTCIYNAVTAASALHGARFFLQRSVGTGTIEITLDNGATWTDITTALDAAPGWYEAVIEQTLANPQIGIRIGTSGDAVIVGNAELALDPASSSTAIAVLTWNSAIFTNGATGSVQEIQPWVPIQNHDQFRSLYYMECVPATADADHGLTDTYFFSTDGGDSDGAISNMANGSLWSTQNLDNLGGTGGSTAQVTRTAVAGEKHQICAWFDEATDQAQYSVDGDISAIQTNFGAYEIGTDDKLFLIQRQAGVNTSTSVLIRNFRRYKIESFDFGVDLEFNLLNPAASWGGQNIVRLSDRIDLETENGNPWLSVNGVTATKDSATGVLTVSDVNAASVSYIRQQIPIQATADQVTMRMFVEKDANTSRFPEILLQLTGNSTQTAYIQVNTQTGAVASRAGVGETPVTRDAGSFWEILLEIASNTLNTNINLQIYPAFATTLGGASDITLTGSIGVRNVEVYRGLSIADIPAGIDNAVYTPESTLAPIELTAVAAAGGGGGLYRGRRRAANEAALWYQQMRLKQDDDEAVEMIKKYLN